MTPSIKGWYVPLIKITLSITILCHYGECHYVECRIIFIPMLNVIMMSVMAPCPVVCSMVWWYLIAQQLTMWDLNAFYTLSMDKLKLTGKTWAKFSNLNVGMFINTVQLHSWQKQPNLKLNTWPKQLPGYLQLAIALPSLSFGSIDIFMQLGFSSNITVDTVILTHVVKLGNFFLNCVPPKHELTPD